MLTSILTSVRARVDKPKVFVRVTSHGVGISYTILSTTMYAYGDVIEIVGLGKLIEDHFRDKGFSKTQITITVDDVDMDFMAQYCEADMTSDFDLRSGFYTVASTQVVHRNSAVVLAHWDDGSPDYTIQVAGLDSSGALTTIERAFSRSSSNGSVSFSVDEILSWALSTKSADTGAEIVKISWFVISHGSARKTCFLVDAPEYLTFSFRNIFNVWEYVDVCGVLKQKTEVSREMAICAGRATYYDRKAERSFELTTGPLSDSEARYVEALVMSSSVNLETGSDTLPILVTEQSVERDNNDESLVTMKFSFRFASEKVQMSVGEISDLSPSRSRIFSREFTAEFA